MLLPLVKQSNIVSFEARETVVGELGNVYEYVRLGCPVYSPVTRIGLLLASNSTLPLQKSPIYDWKLTLLMML